MKRVFILVTLLLLSSISSALDVTYRAPESDSDSRYDYDSAVLKLALEKTESDYGPFRLLPSPPMNFSRAELMAKKNSLPNFIFKQSYSKSLSEDLTFAPFPIDLGIVGYRVCFVSSNLKEEVAKAKTLNDLKAYSMLQGYGWGDVEILRHHGFKVVEVPTYKAMFKMVAAERGDLFCRGTNELKGEFDAHKHIKNFDYDNTFSLVYPLPRFFFTHPSNQALSERVYEGLKRAYKDQSLQKIWFEHYQPSIEFVRLDKRTMFHVENPMLEGLDMNFRQYFFNPIQ